MRNINFLEESLPRHIMNKIPLLKVKVYVRYITRVAIVSIRCSSVTSKLMQKKIEHITMRYANRHGIYFGYSGNNEYKTKLFLGFGSDLDYDHIASRNLSKVPVEIKKTEHCTKPLRLLNTFMDIIGLELEIPQSFMEVFDEQSNKPSFTFEEVDDNQIANLPTEFLKLTN